MNKTIDRIKLEIEIGKILKRDKKIEDIIDSINTSCKQRRTPKHTRLIIEDEQVSEHVDFGEAHDFHHACGDR
jgi:hypothetical protein